VSPSIIANVDYRARCEWFARGHVIWSVPCVAGVEVEEPVVALVSHQFVSIHYGWTETVGEEMVWGIASMAFDVR
jgi:hypothetical protein